MSEMNIQWFPGHMTKARRMIAENVKLVDIVCEIIDARIPLSSRNPDLPELTGTRPRMVILNRVDQADPAQTKAWATQFDREGVPVLQTDSQSGKGVKDFSQKVRTVLKKKIEENEAKGQGGKPLRAMVVGIPNVGKSSFINRVAGRKAAEASDRPGVTRGKQWIKVDKGLELLDTPGILWPKFEDPRVGRNLAFTGAIKDDILDREGLAANLILLLRDRYPERLAERYKLETAGDEDGYALLEMAARKRGFLISGGEYDLERMSAVLLDEFRGGKLGRVSLETPEDL